MRMAQLAPLAESVPPKLYGGTERVVAWLVDELVELGHDVTLFASGDSRTNVGSKRSRPTNCRHPAKTDFSLPLESSFQTFHLTSIYHPIGWQKWMAFMADNVRELRPRIPDTEKITVNLGYVDLGHVDLMVQEGFYSNRTDFIRTAIRNQLERHADVVKESTVRKGLDLGLRNYSREDLEAARRAGEMLHINVLGLATIAQDVTPDLARATIASVSVLGALHATPAVKAALSDRTR